MPVIDLTELQAHEVDGHLKKIVGKAIEKAIDGKLTCPITYELFEDPVFCAGDGQTYERSAIEEWFKENRTSPLTKSPMQSTEIYPNYHARQLADMLRQGAVPEGRSNETQAVQQKSASVGFDPLPLLPDNAFIDNDGFSLALEGFDRDEIQNMQEVMTGVWIDWEEQNVRIHSVVRALVERTRIRLTEQSNRFRQIPIIIPDWVINAVESSHLDSRTWYTFAQADKVFTPFKVTVSSGLIVPMSLEMLEAEVCCPRNPGLDAIKYKWYDHYNIYRWKGLLNGEEIIFTFNTEADEYGIDDDEGEGLSPTCLLIKEYLFLALYRNGIGIPGSIIRQRATRDEQDIILMESVMNDYSYEEYFDSSYEPQGYNPNTLMKEKTEEEREAVATHNHTYHVKITQP
jgi:hypothetical protein|tara:strand:- start:38 stop:1240 length:1203 start_codon:yes stop_codon:yes gene_type:complete